MSYIQNRKHFELYFPFNKKKQEKKEINLKLRKLGWMECFLLPFYKNGVGKMFNSRIYIFRQY